MMVRVSGVLLRFTDYQRVISVDAPTVNSVWFSSGRSSAQQRCGFLFPARR